MKIKKKLITVEYEDAKFTFERPLFDEYLLLIKRKSKDSEDGSLLEEKLNILFKRLIKVEGVESEDGQVTTSDELRKANPEMRDLVNIMAIYLSEETQLFNSTLDVPKEDYKKKEEPLKD